MTTWNPGVNPTHALPPTQIARLANSLASRVDWLALAVFPSTLTRLPWRVPRARRASAEMARLTAQAALLHALAADPSDPAAVSLLIKAIVLAERTARGLRSSTPRRLLAGAVRRYSRLHSTARSLAPESEELVKVLLSELRSLRGELPLATRSRQPVRRLVRLASSGGGLLLSRTSRPVRQLDRV